MTVRKAHAFLALATIFVSACGSDSTGPTSLDANAALQSLAIGLNQAGGIGSTTSEANATFSAIAPVLDQVDVTIDGASQGMYALGLHESYPAGTCEENLFVVTIAPPPPGVCTPPSLTVAVILWQTHSATQVPDRMILLVGDPGTSNFDFTLAGNDFPAAAIYFEGQNKVWSSESGTLTSQVSSTSQTCSIVLPPYAKTATCNIASFAEQGSVVLSAFAVSGPTNEKVTIGIPSITLRGIWLAITEIQPVPFVATATLGRLLPLAPAPLRVAPGKYRISVRR
ncbi:MAG: hypothetical protein DMD72_11580 [Gemmatimonadetes bacterium]|nr:MAG: hypothetical protein DMD72_11580 [Gemmatimonadota bacterium]PYO77754.1 MAG: hypothetical protein DMD63_09840 [Gemmatimonadota bacterium]